MKPKLNYKTYFLKERPSESKDENKLDFYMERKATNKKMLL